MAQASRRIDMKRRSGNGATSSLPDAPAKVASQSDLQTFVIVRLVPATCRVHNLRPGKPLEGKPNGSESNEGSQTSRHVTRHVMSIRGDPDLQRQAHEELYRGRSRCCVPGHPKGGGAQTRHADAATKLSDLRASPGNRLEALKGERRGRHSIRIDDQWHVCLCAVRAPNGSRSATITEGQAMARIRTHPGRGPPRGIHEAAGSLGQRMALALRVPATGIGDILCMEKPRAVTAETAIRLAHYFDTIPEFWRGRTPPHPALSPVTGER